MTRFIEPMAPRSIVRFARALGRLAGAGVVVGFCATAAFAQTWPERPIKVVVPWPPGGVTDAAGRVMVQRLAERMGATIVVENRAGAAATIGAESVARAEPDGYTLLVASAETHAIAPNLRPKLGYNPLRDFTQIVPFAINPFSLVTRADFPASTTDELLALVKAQPGRFTYSSAGVGSASQIAMETFKSLAGVNVLHVPFQGQAPALTSLLGGQTDLQMLPAGSATTLRKAGKVKVFAVTTATRFFDMPDLPTLKEAGFEAMNFANWFGFAGPANLPPAVVQKISAETIEALKSDTTRAMLQKLGVDAYPPMSPADFRKFVEADIARWGEVIRSANIKAE